MSLNRCNGITDDRLNDLVECFKKLDMLKEISLILGYVLLKTNL